MTAARSSQVVAEILRNNTAVKAHASQAAAAVLRKNTSVNIQASHAIAGVLRQNTAVKAQAHQLIASILRKEVTPPNIQVSQLTAETLRPSIITAQVSQVVTEVISAERTLKAILPLSVTLQADLVSGLVLGSIFTASLDTEARLELGTELAFTQFSTSIEVQAALQFQSRLSAIFPTHTATQASLQQGSELMVTLPITLKQRAGLKVYPESVTGFFLLF
ncbi:hypothetical protein [Nitrosomonas communis]|uniref:Uncharacterized protein n=1 Tax=Nitrosomonas communis TaxID=44574 RepID=A0A1I4LRT3_9PROT|nr:hypothetical protein [Nitrosomonas communis]SFL93611.1 hypothetical protein SAMN05421863_100762 [Nitrosomonas communis]